MSRPTTGEFNFLRDMRFTLRQNWGRNARLTHNTPPAENFFGYYNRLNMQRQDYSNIGQDYYPSFDMPYYGNERSYYNREGCNHEERGGNALSKIFGWLGAIIGGLGIFNSLFNRNHQEAPEINTRGTVVPNDTVNQPTSTPATPIPETSAETPAETQSAEVPDSTTPTNVTLEDTPSEPTPTPAPVPTPIPTPRPTPSSTNQVATPVLTPPRTTATTRTANPNTTTTKYRPKINGIIENFSQGNFGDCFFLSQLKAISQTDVGKNILKNSISEDANGNVTVELKGVNERYTFTPQEMKQAKLKYSTGDDDVRAFELAAEKHYEKTGKTLESLGGTSNIAQLITGQSSKTINGNLREIILQLARKDGKNINDPNLYSRSDLTRIQKDKDDIRNLLNKMAEHPGELAATMGIKEEYANDASGLYAHHVFCIKRVEGDYVIFNNPWYPDKEFKISREKFINVAENVNYTDLRS